MKRNTFKVGDKVKLNKVIKHNSADAADHTDRPFKFGVVSKVEPDSYTGPLSIRVEEDCAEEPSRFSTWLHRADIKPRREIKVGDIKVGDKVKITGKAIVCGITFPLGTIGTVVSGPDEDGDYKVEALDDFWFYKASSLKRVKDKNKGIKVGDKVRITGEARCVGIRFAVGSVGEVVDTQDDGGLKVEQDGDSWWYEADQVKLLKEYPELKEYDYWSESSSQEVSALSAEERTGPLEHQPLGKVHVEHPRRPGASLVAYCYSADEVIDNGDGTGTVRTLKQLAKFRAKQAK